MMHLLSLLTLASTVAAAAAAGATAIVLNCESSSAKVTYRGLALDGIETFLGVPYAQDTSGSNRFKPPRPYVPQSGSTIDATKPGPACPQPLGQLSPPLALVNITKISENCLNLNIDRPQMDYTGKKLPVMVWIHGGSFWYGSNMEPTTNPAGMIKQSFLNGEPVIFVRMNYRLGFFGFAQSDTLQKEGSENAGLRDQRMAIEWVRDNIEGFGGDPNRITILGQSSGGLAIGMHILAYGGTKPLPFQRGVAESQSLEPGITGNFTIDAMNVLAKNVSCDATNVHSPETIDCLRKLDTDTLTNAAIATYASDISHNIGDIWLPSVDGDFLPAAPSMLIAEGRFGKADFITGWCEDDLNFYTNTSIATAEDTYDFIRGYLPGFSEASVEKLLGMYPVSEYKPGVNLTVEFYRSARIFRDILMVCPSLLLGEAVAKTKKTSVFHYTFNQTIVGPIEDMIYNVSRLGVGHTSEFAYIFGSKDAYEAQGYSVMFSNSDTDLVERASRSWSTFAATGKTYQAGHDLVEGWTEAYKGKDGPYVMTIGGPHEGLSTLHGSQAIAEVERQKLDERCAFLNDPEIIKGLQF